MIDIFGFGSFRVWVDGRAVVIHKRKTQGLLAYLASNSDLYHERASLVAQFWPDLPQAAAHNNLSKALGEIRALFGMVASDIEIIEGTRHTVLMRSAGTWRFDIVRFSRLIEEAQASTNKDKCAALLKEAVSLYSGEFLKGLSFGDSPEFETWLLLYREHLMLMNRDSLQKLADYYMDLGDFGAARDAARHQLALDSWHEEAHRQLMRALAGLELRADALAQYEACRAVLHSELGLEPEQSTRALYQQIKSGELSTGTSRPLEGASHSPIVTLPKRLFPLVGRSTELATLQRDIADPACRLLTIVGAGGVGKTTLALEAARQAAEGFRHGAVFVPLEHLSFRLHEDLQETLAVTVGAAMGLSFSGPETIFHQLQRELRDKELLLLLDNFEHLLEGTSGAAGSSGILFLIGLLEHAAGLKVLVTSRERFGIPMEYVMTLEGLSVPPQDATATAISDYSSVRLFVEQARRNQRDFHLTAENGPLVVTICRVVGGLPLALELAARWVSHFTLPEIAAAIQENLDFLAAESPQLTARHQSMRATIAYSWQMLSPLDQDMLAGLSIISGRFNRQAALAVTRGSLGSLVRLQGKSLLRQESTGHYSLHPLLRQFVSDRLGGEPVDVQKAHHQRFFTYYLELLAGLGEGLNQAWLGEAMKEISHQIENIRDAWEMALNAGAFELIDDGLQPLYHYYRIQGLFREGRQLFDHTGARLRSVLEQDSKDSIVKKLLGRSLLRQGRLAWLMGEREQAMLLLQEGTDQLHIVPSPPDLARAHTYLGEAALRDGRVDEAEHLLRMALNLYRQEGDSNGIAITLELQAVLANQSQQFDEVDRLFEESIDLSRRSGNRRLEGRSMHDWGVILLEQGKISAAAGQFRQSLEIAHELDLHMPLAFNQSMLGRTERHSLRYEESRRLLINSLQALEGSGYAFYTNRALNMLAEVLAILGKPEEAEVALKKVTIGLRGLQVMDSNPPDYPTLDFLVASAYLFGKTERTEVASHCLRMVLANVAVESDLGQRASQLWREMYGTDYSQADAAGAKPLDAKTLAQVLKAFNWAAS